MSPTRWLWVVGLTLCFSMLGGASCSEESSEPENQGGDGGSHGDGSSSAGATAPDTLDGFCQTLEVFLCDRCATHAGCPSDIGSACLVSAPARDPGGYTQAKGQACLDALAQIDCDAPPLNCQGETAVTECNAYLDGQTDGVDPACP